MAVLNPHLIHQYRLLHEMGEYGVSGTSLKPVVQLCILELSPGVILDYGCGQSNLCDELVSSKPLEFFRYDPSIPEHSSLPITQADFVINTDVMEHIPEQDCSDVFKHLASISSNVFFNISTRPANQILPSGQNAHCTVRSADWWTGLTRNHFADANLVYQLEDQCGIITWESTYPELFCVIREHGLLRDEIAFMQRPFYRKLLRPVGWFLGKIVPGRTP